LRVITVIGSVNIDISTRVQHLPAPGETVLGGGATLGLGGKGANQAVAAARLLGPTSSPVRFIGCIGNDAFGDQALRGLEPFALNLEHLGRSASPTGIALIGVDDQAQNSIIVAPGANTDLTPAHVTPEILKGSSLVCISLEVPNATWRAAIRAARVVGATVVVNASPLDGVQAEDLIGTDVLIVNQLEAALLGAAPQTDVTDFSTRQFQRESQKVRPVKAL
jgi:ribokinase